MWAAAAFAQGREIAAKTDRKGVTRAPFGTLPDGSAVEAISLTNASGMSVTILTYGATIQRVLVPGRDGPADVALGYATLDDYLAGRAYFGATVGRVANRIAGGRFTLDGQSYAVPVNDGDNALHGGDTGFDRQLWHILAVQSGTTPGVTLRLVSKDGDQGFPGTLVVTATFTLDDADVLSVTYTASTDRATPVNLTNHAYWNLAGEGSDQGAMGHLLHIPADTFLPTDAGAIPTGERRAVEGTPFDFRTPHMIGARVRDAGDDQIRIGKGYDHNWNVGEGVTADVRLMARLDHPHSGRTLEVWSNQPGVQFYSGNFLDGSAIGKSGQAYRQGDGLALEPQMPPDTPNQPAFGSVTLMPDQIYRNAIEFRFAATR